MDQVIESTLPERERRSSFCSVVGIKVLKSKIFLEQSNTGQTFSKDKMPTHKSYHSYLIESLKDPAEAAAYLDAVLEDGDFEHILLALKNVAEARTSLADASHKTDPDWENCYQLLARGEVPGLLAIAQLLNGLGLKLSVTVKEGQAV
jgi:DNA-binding phage protein